MITDYPPRLLVHYAPGVLAVLRLDRCPKPNHEAQTGCDRSTHTYFTVVGIDGLEPDEVSWVLSRCWIPQRVDVEVAV